MFFFSGGFSSSKVYLDLSYFIINYSDNLIERHFHFSITGHVTLTSMGKRATVQADWAFMHTTCFRKLGFLKRLFACYKVNNGAVYVHTSLKFSDSFFQEGTVV